MSVEHKNLTGSELHEPKGVETAGSGTAYIANGSGSGTWQDPLASVNNKNLLIAMTEMGDISSPSSTVVIPNPGQACRLVKVVVICESNFATAPNVLTAEIVSGGIAHGTGVSTDLSISCTNGSGVNAVFSGSVSSGNSLTTSQAVSVQTDGGGTGASSAQILCVFDVS